MFRLIVDLFHNMHDYLFREIFLMDCKEFFILIVTQLS